MKKIIFAVLFVFVSGFCNAAAPAWTVNAGQFQYSMNVTAVLNSNCTELSNNNNMLGAFVHDTCRGVAFTNTTVSGRKLAYLLVYSNISGTDTIKFKYYDSVADTVYNSKVTLVFADNGVFGSNNAPFVIKNNDPPTAIKLSIGFIPENSIIGQSVIALSSVDVDSLNTHSYTLVSGAGNADNGKFTTRNDSLVLNALLDVNVQDTLHIRIRSTDNFGCFYEQAFVIKVGHVNHPPTAMVISDSTIFENKPIQTIVGVITGTDSDAGDVLTYSLVSGTGSADNSSFLITGAILRSNKMFNYEVKKVYSIRLRVTDAANTFYEKAFTIYIKDVNDNPTDILIDNRVYENQAPNAFVSKLNTVDEDVKDLFTYTFANVGTNDNSSFSISNDTLRATQTFDFETKNIYSIYLTTTDSGGLYFTKQINIMIRDTLDGPTDITISTDTISENKPAKTYIGKLKSVDINPPTTLHTYTFVSGLGSTDNSQFAISNDSLYSNVLFDYETKSSYSIRVRSTVVNGFYTEKILGITVIDRPDPVTALILSNDTIRENNPVNAIVGSLSSVTTDTIRNFSYTLVSGTGSTDNSKFNIATNNLRLGFSADFETKTSYSVRIRTTNSTGLFFEKQFTINITNQNESPIANNDSVAVYESIPIGTTVATATARDTDAFTVLTYHMITTGLPFTINDSTGKINTTQTLNYEAIKGYTIKFRVTDNGVPQLSDTATVIVTVLDVAEAVLPINNYVSPNGDGKNDKLVIANPDLYANYELTIYTDTGVVVYKTKEYANDWDGSGLNSGVYFYTLLGNITYKGTITLVK